MEVSPTTLLGIHKQRLTVYTLNYSSTTTITRENEFYSFQNIANPRGSTWPINSFFVVLDDVQTFSFILRYTIVHFSLAEPSGTNRKVVDSNPGRCISIISFPIKENDMQLHHPGIKYLFEVYIDCEDLLHVSRAWKLFTWKKSLEQTRKSVARQS